MRCNPCCVIHSIKRKHSYLSRIFTHSLLGRTLGKTFPKMESGHETWHGGEPLVRHTYSTVTVHTPRNCASAKLELRLSVTSYNVRTLIKSLLLRLAWV